MSALSPLAAYMTPVASSNERFAESMVVGGKSSYRLSAMNRHNASETFSFTC